MYVLVKLDKRAETTDAILYYVADWRTDLEEILLSLYDEIVEMRDAIERYSSKHLSDEQFKQIIDEYMNTFYILDVPYLGVGG